MSKKAYLVEFSVRTRVTLEAPDTHPASAPNNNAELFDAATKQARENICSNPEGYLFGDNIIEIAEDTECPYGALENDKRK